MTKALDKQFSDRLEKLVREFIEKGLHPQIMWTDISTQQETLASKLDTPR